MSIILTDGNDPDEEIATNDAAEVYALNGNDRVYGGNIGNGSAWYGGDGNDALLYQRDGFIDMYGGRGNDTIGGGTSGDYLYGEAGDDLIVGAEFSWGNAVNLHIVTFVDTTSGDDYLDGGDGRDAIYGYKGDDVIYGGEGDDLQVTIAVASALSGNVAMTITAGLYGGDGDDFIDGGRGADDLDGGAGADRLLGGEGYDTLEGGPGGDRLDGGAEGDAATYRTATAGVSADLQFAANNTGDAAGDTYASIEYLWGSNFADTLFGDAGGNSLNGYDGNDVLFGREGDDGLTGGFGSDFLYGEGGHDLLYGGADTDYLTGGAGADVLQGDNGFDFAAYVYAPTGLTVDLEFGAMNTGEAAGDVYSSVEGLIGSGFGDSLRGDESGNLIFGGGGDDTLYGRGGDDSLVGDAGNDVLTGEAGKDTFIHRTGDGQDTVTDFTVGANPNPHDVLDILEGPNFDTFFEVMAVAQQVGANTVITFSAGDTITLLNVTKTALAIDDFSFA